MKHIHVVIGQAQDLVEHYLERYRETGEQRYALAAGWQMVKVEQLQARAKTLAS